MKTAAVLFAALACAFAASAHISVDPPRAETGAIYRGVLHVAHGCDNAPTTSVDLRFPNGVSATAAKAQGGWSVVQTGNEIIWTARRGQALDPKQTGEVPFELRVAAQPGALWLKVFQRCQGASAEWAEVPAQGTSTEGMKHPAVLLRVISSAEAAAYRAQPAVEGAWVRASVAGQQSTGAFMRITAKEPTQLVGAESPVAGIAQVHQMTMEGDVMKMRPASVIDLPAGRPFELKPGGFHLMLQDLKKPIEAGSSVPVTLVFRNAAGVESRMDLRIPASVQVPGPAAAGAMPMEHKH